MPVRITPKGSWNRTIGSLKRMQNGGIFATLEKFGAAGVQALSEATPTDTGQTGQSWYYEVVQRRGYFAIHWYNSNVVDGKPVAILLQYGHGTGTGGYVQGRDYINPAIRPVFDKIDTEMRKVVSTL